MVKNITPIKPILVFLVLCDDMKNLHPSYIAEKYMDCFNSYNPENLLSDGNKIKLNEYCQKWKITLKKEEK